MVEYSEDPELAGNIKLGQDTVREAENNGFQKEMDSTQTSTATSTLDEPVAETIVRGITYLET